MADAQARRAVRFEDDSEIAYIALNQQEDSTDTDTDDSDETIRPASPAFYTYTRALDRPSGSPEQRMSRSTSVSLDGLLYATGASTTPLLHSPRRCSSQSVMTSARERQFRVDGLIAYGSMAAPFGQTAVQQTQLVSSWDQSRLEMGMSPLQEGGSLGTWLGRLNILRRSRGSTMNEEDDSEVVSNDSSSPNLKKSMVKTCQKLGSHSSRLSARTWRAPFVRTISNMVFPVVALIVIGYSITKLAIMGRNMER